MNRSFNHQLFVIDEERYHMIGKIRIDETYPYDAIVGVLRERERAVRFKSIYSKIFIVLMKTQLLILKHPNDKFSKNNLFIIKSFPAIAKFEYKKILN